MMTAYEMIQELSKYKAETAQMNLFDFIGG